MFSPIGNSSMTSSFGGFAAFGSFSSFTPANSVNQPSFAGGGLGGPMGIGGGADGGFQPSYELMQEPGLGGMGGDFGGDFGGFGGFGGMGGLGGFDGGMGMSGFDGGMGMGGFNGCGCGGGMGMGMGGFDPMNALAGMAGMMMGMMSALGSLSGMIPGMGADASPVPREPGFGQRPASGKAHGAKEKGGKGPGKTHHGKKNHGKKHPGKTHHSKGAEKSGSKSSGQLGGSGSKKFDSIIMDAAKKYHVDPNLIKSVIKQESNFDPGAGSSAGAQGLMQLMPATAASLGCKNPSDPRQNIFAGTKYLAQMLKSQKGNVKTALAAYNAGPGNVAKYGGVPPFGETQTYVKNIMADLASRKSA